ncbi:endonuclease domain-containing protein [Acinetobacter sp. c3-l95]|uniref:endonuclease domain-containing protein n=1 Tax=Acinetobacter sp. c3-l95 TaxID=3342804 RepID=UPI0035BA0784
MSHQTNPTTLANAKILRKNMTEAEKVLWNKLRANQLGVKFRRQVPIGGYVVDFFCYSENFAIELGCVDN